MKKSLLLLAVGVGIGYVLGARAGRERYDLIVAKAEGLWEDPRVVKARREAANFAREQGPVIVDRAQAVAKAAPGVVAERAKATVAAARSVADRGTAAASTTAATAATKIGELRDAALEDDDEF